MTSIVDSEAHFLKRASEIHVDQPALDALTRHGFRSLGQLAFAVGQPGQVISESDFQNFCRTIVPSASAACVASIRRPLRSTDAGGPATEAAADISRECVQACLRGRKRQAHGSSQEYVGGAEHRGPFGTWSLIYKRGILTLTKSRCLILTRSWVSAGSVGERWSSNSPSAGWVTFSSSLTSKHTGSGMVDTGSGSGSRGSQPAGGSGGKFQFHLKALAASGTKIPSLMYANSSSNSCTAGSPRSTLYKVSCLGEPAETCFRCECKASALQALRTEPG